MENENKPLVPEGWNRKEIKRKNGKNRTDVYIYSPAGTLFRSKSTLLHYIEAKKLPFKIDDFQFTAAGTKINNMTSKESLSTEKSLTEKMEEKDENVGYSGDEYPLPEVYLTPNAEYKNNPQLSTEESITDDVLVMSQGILNMTESCLQLKYDKERTEKTLLNLEQEAKDIIGKLQEEIELLTKVNSELNNNISNQEDEITYLRKSVTLSSNTKMNPENCKNCELLNLKISHLRKENLDLMESIVPCPSQKKETDKTNGLNKDFEMKIKELERETNEILTAQEEQVKDFEKHLRKLNTENSKLRDENRILRKQNKELTDEKTALSECQNIMNVNKSSTSPSKNTPPSLKSLIKNKKNRNNKEILILADSHGRNLTSNLKSVWHNNEYDISAILKPSAVMSEVINDVKGLTKLFTKRDTLIVIGGSNDELGHAEKNIINTYKNLLNNSKHTNVVVSSLPYWHHMPEVNNRISLLNIEIEQEVLKHEHASYLPIHLLQRHHYTSHGLHFNRQGKRKIALMMKDVLCAKAGLKCDVMATQTHINIVEADMEQMIEDHKNDPLVAFSHTISGDLSYDRSMTAGVAVVFRKQFGRPQVSDYIHTKLTCQTVENGATIYGLVTKNRYYEKPTIEDYDESFMQLRNDCKNKNIKTLICSPMGCVRDQIKLEHFAKNITKLHQETSATVYIVSQDQPTAKRVLRRGLSHSVFMEKLQTCINNYISCPTSEDSTTRVSEEQPNAEDTPVEKPQNHEKFSNESSPPTDIVPMLQSPVSLTLNPDTAQQDLSEVLNSVQKQSNVIVVQAEINESRPTVVNSSLGLN